MTHDKVAHAYESRAVDVEELLGATVSSSDPDRNLIEPWAATVQGSILDVGSGTGRWTGHLATLGYDAEGLEPAHRLVARARDLHPGVTFHHGSIGQLADMRRRWDGMLAWYSVIHMGIQHLPQALDQLRAALADDGTLLMSFFSGPALESLPHPVAPAFLWPMDQMTHALEIAGFKVLDQHWAPSAPHAYILAKAA